MKLIFHNKNAQKLFNKKAPFSIKTGALYNKCTANMDPHMTPGNYTKAPVQDHTLVDRFYGEFPRRGYVISETDEVFFIPERHATIIDVLADEVKVARDPEESPCITFYKNSEYIGMVMPIVLGLNECRITKHKYLEMRTHHDQ